MEEHRFITLTASARFDEARATALDLNVKHIQQATRCRVQIKGRGSGFIESSTGRESDEALNTATGGLLDVLHISTTLSDDLGSQVETGDWLKISGFIESSTGRESDEAMFLHVA
jgi:hypothetical protein